MPIDGEWMNENKLVIRIEHGEMFTTIPATNGMPAGALLAKDIQRNGAGSFKCAKESYNKNTGIVDYGEGLITILQNDIIQIKTFPNSKTGFGYAKPTQLRKIRLDDEAAYRAELAAMQEGKQESHVNNDNSSVMNDDILSNNREPSSKNIATQKRIALVIGNSAYGSGSLKNPANDAKSMSDCLKKLGFNVILRTNASKREMGKAIEDFRKQLKGEDVGLFFYAGHAVQVNGDNYLIPIRANITEEEDIEYEAVDAGRILATMHSAKSRVNIVILDACRDNPYAKSIRSATRGLAIISKAPIGTIVSYSTSPGDIAFDGKGNNSPYTSSLMQYMREPGLTIEQVFKNTRQKIIKETNGKQIPWELSSLQGDFYFAPNSVKTIAAKNDSIQELVQQTEKDLDKHPQYPTPRTTDMNGRFMGYDNGTVIDTKTKLMWAATDNGTGINWQNAKKYCENYHAGGYADWRMPTLDELETLFDIKINGINGCNLTRLINLTNCYPWASDSRGAYFLYYGGGRAESKRFFFFNSFRALPVRTTQ